MVKGASDGQAKLSAKASGTDYSLTERIAADPALWAEIHEAAIRTINELRMRLKLNVDDDSEKKPTRDNNARLM